MGIQQREIRSSVCGGNPTRPGLFVGSRFRKTRRDRCRSHSVRVDEKQITSTRLRKWFQKMGLSKCASDCKVNDDGQIVAWTSLISSSSCENKSSFVHSELFAFVFEVIFCLLIAKAAGYLINQESRRCISKTKEREVNAIRVIYFVTKATIPLYMCMLCFHTHHVV